MEQQHIQSGHRQLKPTDLAVKADPTLIFTQNSQLIYSILKMFYSNSYTSIVLHDIAKNLVSDFQISNYEKHSRAFCLRILYTYILKSELPITTETELVELSKEELFALTLKDRHGFSIYEIATACDTSMGAISLRLALARNKAFLGGVSITTQTGHKCLPFQFEVEEKATAQMVSSFNMNQKTCIKCHDFIFKKKQSLDFFERIPREPIPESLQSIHITPLISKEGKKYKIQISTAPWYYKILFEGVLASAIMIVLVFSVPAIKKIYEFWLERRVDIYNLADFTATSSLSTDPTIAIPKALFQNSDVNPPATAQTQPTSTPTAEAPIQPAPIQAENEFIGKESERLSSNKVYRILIKTDSPENLKNSVFSSIQMLKYQNTSSGEMISELPGGVLFDFFVPFEEYKSLLNNLSVYGETKVIITHSKEKGISGKARIKIWLQKI